MQQFTEYDQLPHRKPQLTAAERRRTITRKRNPWNRTISFCKRANLIAPGGRSPGCTIAWWQIHKLITQRLRESGQPKTFTIILVSHGNRCHKDKEWKWLSKYECKRLSHDPAKGYDERLMQKFPAFFDASIIPTRCTKIDHAKTFTGAKIPQFYLSLPTLARGELFLFDWHSGKHNPNVFSQFYSDAAKQLPLFPKLVKPIKRRLIQLTPVT